MNKPDRGLLPGGLSRESSTLISWRNYYPKNSPAYQDIDRLICDIKLLRGLLPYTGIRYIINAMGYGKYLKEYGKKMQTDFSNYKESLDKILYISKEFNSYEKCLSSLTDCEKTDGGRKPDQEKIFLYTFHGCKGLEFDRVFILDAIEDITPSKGSLDIEEERRMFYVAMTRAKSELTVCIPMEYKKNKTYPSRFVSECSCDIIN